MRDDPLGVFNFYITLVDTSNPVGALISASFDYWVAGFSDCSGLDAAIEMFDYKEGGVNGYVHKFAGRASFSNITLKHGVIFRFDDLWQWHHDWITGKGKRKDGLIVLQDEARRPAKLWRFKRGIPMKWTGPQLSGSQSNAAVESLEIAHEGLDLEAEFEMDVRIDAIQTQVVVTEGVGSLSPEDLRKIVALVLEHLEHKMRSEEQRKMDVSIRDRTFDRKGL